MIKTIPKLSKYYRGLLLVFATWGVYFLWLWPHMFRFSDGQIVAGHVTIWGDFGAHLSYAAPFAYRNVSDIFTNNPILYGAKFTYPFVADGLTGLVARSGINIVTAFVLTSIVFMWFVLYALYRFFYKNLQSAAASFFAISMFLLSGGIGFYYYLQDVISKKSEIFYPFYEYTHLQDKNIFVINVITSEFLPQRAFLLGMPITLLIAIFLYTNCSKVFSKILLLQVVVASIFTALLLFTHVHSLMVLIIVCAVMFVFKIKHYKFFIYYGALSAIFCLLIYSSYYANSVESNFSYLPGWLSNKKELNINFFYFWFLNYGLFLPLALIATVTTKMYKNPFVISGYVIFIIANLVSLQNWAWDNTKVFTYVYLFLTIPIIFWFKNLVNKSRLLVLVVAPLYFLLIFSGALDIIRLNRYNKHSSVLHSKQAVEMAQKLNKIIQSGDVVLTGFNHNNAVSNLTKAQIVMGFDGWLWSYGLNYYPTKQDVISMYKNPQTSQDLFNKYNVKYVLIGEEELRNLSPNITYFDSNSLVVLTMGEYTVYKLK
jgi:hypothetical protein